MFETLLVANRGEIACRIFRTARRLGLRTVAVYSDADATAQHVRQADVALCIGAAPAAESYLDIEAVLDAARRSGAGAIHPGYGFLSENAAFAQACVEAGIAFVGPSAEAIRAMGSKIEAKRLVAAAGTPVVPGYQDDDQSDARLLEAAQQVGFPLLIKASAGGGGKGMRLVRAASEFADALAGARREARSAFGDERVLLERYLQEPKHLEVQILADTRGHTLHLWERDCSVQRRHQKVLEEAPAPGVSPELRTLLGEAAVQAAKAIGYYGAGTVEFIAEGDRFYFMEMNTRLQVEHPVTEAITGLDLVEWQLRIAAGERLELRQDEVALQGHAIEARVYAENPRRRFLPSTGTLVYVSFPDDVRVDSGVATGDQVTMHYDPMLAKIIAHGRDRQAALTALDSALARTELAGVEHNVGFLRALLGHPEFRNGRYTTHLLDDTGSTLLREPGPADAVCAALALRAALQASARWTGAGAADACSGAPGIGGPWSQHDGFRLNLPRADRVRLLRNREALEVALDGSGVRVADQALSLEAVRVEGQQVSFRLDGEVVRARTLVTPAAVYVMRGGATERFERPVTDVAALAVTAGGGERIVSPMPGQVIGVAVKVGDKVKAGQLLFVVEAMKMEHSVTAPRAGTVRSVACAAGDRVEEGVELVALDA
ncbi:MAG: biotin carboxylase N-terminal domain-containing protein [Pseudomonadales bacterium]